MRSRESKNITDGLHSLQLTAKAPEIGPRPQKMKVVFLTPSVFRCELLVLGIVLAVKKVELYYPQILVSCYFSRIEVLGNAGVI